MSNSYFRFKQFTVHQDRCAMKVSTDACVQGAWAPLPDAARLRILDVGAGTGLLSLMLAQRAPQAEVDAIELDADAAEQAQQNIAASPFASRIRVFRADAVQWRPDHLYDYIICNPPFFKQSLLGPDAGRNHARHHVTLLPADLVALLGRTMAENGQACFLWPAKEHGEWVALLAAAGFYIRDVLEVRDRAHTKVNRVISIAGRSAVEAKTDTLILKAPDGAYTADFCRLLSGFYLYL